MLLSSDPTDNIRIDENVFLFVPNLIGYLRVLTAAASLYYMPIHPKACTVLYFVSCILDAVDGQAARALNQTSKFGAVLDMVTDRWVRVYEYRIEMVLMSRCATACLQTFLAITYPRWTLFFQFLITLDFSSHYMHMYS
jgi:CDP-diacylglycerol--inositol 3-phosphatidyltransferase